MQVEQKVVELVPGYGVTLTQRKVISNSGSSPTRMIRLLMSAFFDEDVLATSSCFGSGVSHSKLDEDVIAACISNNIQFILHIMLSVYTYFTEYVQDKYPEARFVLVTAINDKCAQSRVKQKQQSK